VFRLPRGVSLPLTAVASSSTIPRPMVTLGRAALLLLAVLALTVAGIPPALDEDRSEPGFCSPDCPLQQDGHSAAAVIASPPRPRPADTARPCRAAVHEFRPPAAAGSPDTPRAPPRA